MTGIMKYDPEYISPEEETAIRIHQIAGEVERELIRAKKLHPSRMHNPHEAHSVIQEEFEEFWDEVKAFNLPKGRDTRDKMREELIQLAAMAMRAILEVTDDRQPQSLSAKNAQTVSE